MLTVSRAAKEAGVTREIIIGAIRSGKLPAKKDDRGIYQIEEAELINCYNLRTAPSKIDVTRLFRW
jgi:hypothetical protein